MLNDNTANFERELLCDREVGHILGVSRSKVWALARAGRIVKVKLGTKTSRFTRQSVLRLAHGEANETAAA